MLSISNLDCSNSGGPLGLRLFASMAVLCCGLLTLRPASAQVITPDPPTTFILPSQSEGASYAAPYIALKPSGRAIEKPFDGATYVALASGLQSVFLGREPKSLQELKALELQQSLVAKAIEQVTVNVQQGTAQGSGVIISADGFVLTAAHVAGGKDRDAYVKLSDGTQLRARTLGMDRDKDAGLLKIEDSRFVNWPYATIGRSNDLKVGQWCVAAGHPGGWQTDRGSVIRVGRLLKIGKSSRDTDAHTLFTDCALIGGDSGGPLFTLEGKLIGIHSRIGTDVEDNMHVPIDVFATDWNRLVNKEVWGVLPGYRPVIGVTGAKGDSRPLIASVTRDSPADRADLLVGDLVLSVDGKSISTFDELRAGVEACMPGDTLTLVVQRGNQVLRIPVIVGVHDGSE